MKTNIETLAAGLFCLHFERELLYNEKEPATVRDIHAVEGYPQYYQISVGRSNWYQTYSGVFTRLMVSKGETIQPEGVIGLYRGNLPAYVHDIRRYQFKDDQERGQLLLEIIKRWAGKPITLFCNGEGCLHAFDWNKWSATDPARRDRTPLGWKYPSQCGTCVITGKLMDAIFGSEYPRVPFVENKGSRRYAIDLDKLIIFAAEGGEGLETAAKQKADEEIQTARLQHEQRVTTDLQGATVSDTIRQQLTEHLVSQGTWDRIKVQSPNLVVAHGSRSEYGASAGVGQFHEVRVWYKGQRQKNEWQWRDRYSANQDRPDLCVNGIGQIEVEICGERVEIKIELENRNHGSRFTTFTFEDKEVGLAPIFSAEEQAAFKARFTSEVQRIMDEKHTAWDLTLLMQMPTGPSRYRTPTIKQRVLNAAQGIGALVVETQIDHCSMDRQMQSSLYILRFAEGEMRCLTTEQAYERLSGGQSPVITVVDLDSSKIEFNTSNGLQISKFE